MEKRFTKIYEQYYKWACKIIYDIVKDYSWSQDISQNIFIKVHENMHKIDDGKEKAWIYKCAKNESISYIRKNRRIELYGLNLEELYECYGLEPFVMNDFAEKIYKKEFQKYLLNRVKQQNVEWYEILISIYYEGKEYTEVAKKLGITVENLRSKTHRARKWIQNELKDEYYEIFYS